MGEIIREYYEDGTLLSEVYTINGKKNGCNKLYDMNGQLQEICNY